MVKDSKVGQQKQRVLFSGFSYIVRFVHTAHPQWILQLTILYRRLQELIRILHMVFQ